MGNLIARLFGRVDAEKRILMLGLDAAGKTTILYQLQLGDAITTIPTIGWNVESVKYKNIHMTIWDISRQHIRPLYRHYFHNIDALIYVVDSSDHKRIDQCAELFHHILADDLLQHICILIFANKYDLSETISPKELAQALGLNKIRSRQWYIQPSIATTGDGLYQGLDWMWTTLNEKRNYKHE